MEHNYMKGSTVLPDTSMPLGIVFAVENYDYDNISPRGTLLDLDVHQPLLHSL